MRLATIAVSVFILLTAFDGAVTPLAAQETVTPLMRHNETRLLAGGESECRLEPYSSGYETFGFDLVMGLANALIPGAVGRGVDALAGYLRSQATATASELETLGTGTYLYRVKGETKEPDLKCVAVVRGEFGASVGAGASGRFKAPELAALGLAAPPEIYLELHIQYSTDRTALRVVPAYLYFRRTAAKAGTNKPKDIELVLTFAVPGGDSKSGVAGAAFGVVPIHIRNIPPGSEVDRNLLRGGVSSWIPLPAETKENSGAKLDATVRTRPINLLATYRENDDPRAFFQFLANVLTDSKNGIVEQAKIPTTQAAQ
ncbi:hypothetical protein TSA6c_14645 [Azospirillum sp. TSA6c]|uniref:hypothetical protein n=1 Tax=Azospirillum sp. TSA6c TaxID=709813 RepID=UPI000D604808|nr:hypothetical protein [Azospirillum sp. TSA6c]PWC47767.1 hypothetical protein TSA6c_14645 [Azospirillum sp. TSA6c]